MANFTPNMRDKWAREKEIKDGVSMSEAVKTQIGRAFRWHEMVKLSTVRDAVGENFIPNGSFEGDGEFLRRRTRERGVVVD